MIIETLRTHWSVCQKFRHGTEAEQRMAKAILQSRRFFPLNNKAVDKAMRNVDIQPKKTA